MPRPPQSTTSSLCGCQSRGQPANLLSGLSIHFWETLLWPTHETRIHVHLLISPPVDTLLLNCSQIHPRLDDHNRATMADATAFSRAGIKSIHGPASRRHLNPEPLSTSYRQVPGLSSVSHPGSRPDEESGNASDLVPLSPGSRDIGNSKDENSAPNPWLSIPPKNGNLVDPAYEHLVDPANGHLVDFVNGHLVDPGGVFAPAPSSWAPLPSYYYTSDGGQWSPYPRFSSEPFLLPPSPVLPTGDRPFKCDQCSQSFQRKHDLNRHKRIHLAIKPFPCTHCDKEFSRKDALKVSNDYTILRISYLCI